MHATMQVADAENLFALVYQFSELQPGESLQEHVQRQVAAGTCPHPSQEVRGAANTCSKAFWKRFS